MAQIQERATVEQRQRGKTTRYNARYTVDGILHAAYGQSKTAAQERRREAIALLNAGGTIAGSGRTYADKTVALLGARWLTSLTGGSEGLNIAKSGREVPLSSTTTDNYAAILTRHCGVVLGGMRTGKAQPWGTTFGALLVAKVTPQDIRRVLDATREAGYSVKVRQGIHGRIVGMFKYAVQIGWLEGGGGGGYKTAADQVDAPSGETAPRASLDAAHAQAFIAHVHGTGSRFSDAIEVLIRTGMRPGELLGLRWDDVDLEAGRIRVTGSMKRVRDGLNRVSHLERGMPKSKSSTRPVRVDAAIRACLDRQAARQAVEHTTAVQTGKAWRGEGFVFGSLVGGATHAVTFNDAFRAAADGAGSPVAGTGLVAHGCRHTFASIHVNRLVSEGMTFDKACELVAPMLGHKDAKVTRTVYAHLDPDTQEQASEASWDQAGSVF